MDDDRHISEVAISYRPAMVEVCELSKEYKIGRQKVQALSCINLSIHQGEFVALVGASGSGKSTLLQMIGGLDRPTSGTVSINDKDVSKMSDGRLSAFRNQTIGFVFQSFYLQPFLTVAQNIELALMPPGTKRAVRTQRINDIAEKVGLTDRLRHKPSELSGGQIQRVAIARALVNVPSIILADEPTGNLDSQRSAEIVALFRRLSDELGVTVIIATHDESIAQQADRVVTIKDGRLQ